MSSMDLVEFLTARLDEDAQIALAAKGEWVDAESTQAGLTHLQRHGPARVLADVAAKRGILENHGDQHDCGDPRSYEYPYVGCRDLRLLAQPYADHPDYQPEWAL